MKKVITITFILIIFLTTAGLNISSTGSKNKIPKLVVGIIVDQMAFDFIERYRAKYSERGFKRLINNGFFCKNAKLSHFPSYTAPGHASIYTGTVPSINGITGNDWYDREKEKIVYCADDETCLTVGSISNGGKMSPSSLLSSTITDELIHSNNKSKVIGIALKDRGAIFPAGHTGGSAYWFDEENAKWITSTYYTDKLPGWVEKFNEKNLPEEYLSKPWNTLLPIESYTESTEDDNEFEDKYIGEEKPVFPHNLQKLKSENKQILRTSPFGNSLTKDFAIESILNENLGKDYIPDFISISFSSTDYVGHKFGPYSIETEDTYLRVDLDIADILEYLDNTVGSQNYLVFLTADHGVCNNPLYMKSKGYDAGTFYTKNILDSVNSYLNRTYNKENLALYFLNQQVYLNNKLIEESGLNIDDIALNTGDYIRNNIEGVKTVYTSMDLENGMHNDPSFALFKNGYYKKRCGEVFVNFKEYWIEDRVRGAEHGGPHHYDIHIPLIWYGAGIPKGETSEPVKIIDIAPTLSTILKIPFPDGCTGKPIKEVTIK